MASFKLCFVYELQVRWGSGGCRVRPRPLRSGLSVYKGRQAPCLSRSLRRGENKQHRRGPERDICRQLRGCQVKCSKNDLPLCDKEIAAFLELFRLLAPEPHAGNEWDGLLADTVCGSS